MNRIYKPNILLWLEDDLSMLTEIWKYLNCIPKVTNAFGGRLRFFRSDIGKEVEEAAAGAEIEKLVSEAGDAPALINPWTAQLARNFFARYIPAAGISDSGFPLNGQKVMEWLKSHELGSYPLLGFTGTRWDSLSPETQELFGTTGARHLRKGSLEALSAIVEHVIYSKALTRIMYGS